MKTLHITVADKTATYRERDGEIVCGNSDYEIEFAFDSEWSSHVYKTARFVYNGKYQDVAFSGNTCSVPIIRGTTAVAVGVYAGDLTTTTPAIIGCKKSILCDNPLPSDPEDESIYTQILEAVDEAVGDAIDTFAESDNRFVKQQSNGDSNHKVYVATANNKGTGLLVAKAGHSGAEGYSNIPVRENVKSKAHPGTFEIAHPVMTEGEDGYSAKHPMTVGIAEERYAKKTELPNGIDSIRWSVYGAEPDANKLVYACQLGNITLTDTETGETTNDNTTVIVDFIHPVLYSDIMGVSSPAFIRYDVSASDECYYLYVHGYTWYNLTFRVYSLTDHKHYSLTAKSVIKWLQ